MSTTTRKAAADRFFDALIERQAGLYDAVRSNSERSHRFSRSLIEGARAGSRDWAEVGRRWITNPTDVVGIYEAMTEAVGNGQQRVLALTREWIEDVVESQRESRDVIRAGVGDWREAIEQVQANAPEFLRRSNWGRRSNGNGSGRTETPKTRARTAPEK
jgi:hypothetical protein